MTTFALIASFFRDCDPDIITGYNINHFDIYYLLRRGRRETECPKLLFSQQNHQHAIRGEGNEWWKAYGTSYLVDLHTKEVNNEERIPMSQWTCCYEEMATQMMLTNFSPFNLPCPVGLTQIKTWLMTTSPGETMLIIGSPMLSLW